MCNLCASYKHIMKNMYLSKNASSQRHTFTDTYLSPQIADENSIVLDKEQTATVSFTNPFSHPVSGVLTVAGGGLIQGKIYFR